MAARTEQGTGRPDKKMSRSDSAAKESRVGRGSRARRRVQDQANARRRQRDQDQSSTNTSA